MSSERPTNEDFKQDLKRVDELLGNLSPEALENSADRIMRISLAAKHWTDTIQPIIDEVANLSWNQKRKRNGTILETLSRIANRLEASMEGTHKAKSLSDVKERLIEVVVTLSIGYENSDPDRIIRTYFNNAKSELEQSLQ